MRRLMSFGLLLLASPAGAQDYRSLGPWALPMASAIGMPPGGAQALQGALPRTGTASYAGTMSGTETVGAGGPVWGTITGASKVTADFGRSSVDVRFTGVKESSPSGTLPWMDGGSFGGTATLKGGSFTGTDSATVNGCCTTTSSRFTGNLSGTLTPSSAQGLWSLSSGKPGGMTASGSFAGRR